MSDAKSTSLETGVINHLFGGVAYAQPIEWWIGIYSTNPTEDIQFTTTRITSLHRMTQDGALPIWTRTQNQASNSYDVYFPPVSLSETWVVSHFALFDSNVDGSRPLYYGALGTVKTLQSGDVLVIPANNLVIREL